jgi:hypothetical protein
VDLKRAAAVLGLVPADVRLKTHYAIPEIWLANDDARVAEAAAATLREAGLRVVVVPGSALAAIPPPQPVVSFSFEATGLQLQGDAQLTLDYGAAIIAVLFTPRPSETKEALPPPSLDLYAPTASERPRWTVVQGATGFAGMGTRQTASFGTNVRAFAADVEQRFPAAKIDRRLVNMQVRRRTGLPPAGVVRHGYSFATTALHQLLESIAPGLSAVEHEELAVRLTLLTRAAE